MIATKIMWSLLKIMWSLLSSQGHPRLVKALANMYSKVYNRDIDGMSEVCIVYGSIINGGGLADACY